MTLHKSFRLPPLVSTLLLIALMIAVGVSLAFTAATLTPAMADDESKGHDRIVAVGGSVTEIVYALGEEDRLIARDTTSMYPAEAMALPDVGYIRRLSPEGVLSVNPDRILMLEGSGPPETLALLVEAGVPITTIPEGFSARGIIGKVQAVGDALGVSDKASELAAKLQSDLNAARVAASTNTKDIRVLFILSMNGGRILASGTETAADGILTLAGAQNALTDFTGYKQLSEEAVLEAAPDIILMMDRGGDHGASGDQVFGHPSIALTPAGSNKRLIKMDGLLLLGFGPRTAEAVRTLAEQIAAFEISPGDKS
jgi:iron complex transport system substrate-binding protein